MSSTKQSITGRGRAACGCEGAVIDGVSTVVSLRVTVPCAGGHPYLVVAGTIERFAHGTVTPAGDAS